MDFYQAREMMKQTLDYDLELCDDDDERNHLYGILASDGAYDYYSQINGTNAIDSYAFLYQYFAENGEESPNECINQLIYDLL